MVENATQGRYEPQPLATSPVAAPPTEGRSATAGRRCWAPGFFAGRPLWRHKVGMMPTADAASAVRERSRSRAVLMIALGIDNAGSGLFLPLVAVYVVRVVALPLSQVGLLLTAGTVVGLAAPLLAGRIVDRVGARVVVIASQLLQAAGLGAYLLADGALGVVVAAALVAAGTQTFYSALFALIADVAPPGPRDRSFALVDMVRTACFGAGALGAAVLLSVVDTQALALVVLIDAATFLVAACVLLVGVRTTEHRAPAPAAGALVPATAASSAPTQPAPAPTAGGGVWSDRPYLALIAVVALLGLPADFFLVGFAVYALDIVEAPRWLPGAGVAMLTLTGASLAAAVVTATRTWPRTRAMAAGGWCLAIWAAATAAALVVPAGWVVPWLLGAALVLAAGSLLLGTRANAIAEAAAPPHQRGRYLAAFQYAFTLAGLGATALVSAYAIAAWLPWAVVFLAAVIATACLPALARHLPTHAIHPHPAAPGPTPSATSRARQDP